MDDFTSVIDAYGVLPATGHADNLPMLYGVKHWRLDKYDGDPPQDGEEKAPVEYIEGGDGLPTRRYVLRDGSFSETSLEE